jgi:phospholipase C
MVRSSGSAWVLHGVGVLAVCGVTLACSSDHAGTGNNSDAGTPGTDAGSVPCGLTESLAAQRSSCGFKAGALPVDTLGTCAGKKNPIEHIVVIMQENRSFDHYFGHLPGHGQDDVDVPPASTVNPVGADAGADAGTSAPWFHEPAYCVADTDHGWGASHGQWNDGKNDGFALTNRIAADPTGSRALGYYDQTDIPFYYSLASNFAISDRYFCSVLGPTYPNRLYLYAGTSFGIVTTDPNTIAPPGVPNLFRSMTEQNVDWKEYKSQIAATLILADFATEPAQASHYVDISEFAKDAAAGTLPAVSFLDPIFIEKPWVEDDEHPPADIQLGEHWVYEQVQALIHSPEWKSSALFITYDEHGGLYDHVSPPAACAPDDTPPRLNPELGGFDRLGFRVPLMVVSPYAKRHFVSHVVHSHTSLLRFIESKFGLPALTNRDANSDALFDLFDFEAPPQLAIPDLAEPAVSDAQVSSCMSNFP